MQVSFATLLATPCSALFLGTAVAFALATPLPQLWGLFIAMSIGMSLPWLLIATRPTLALRLPRPGPWMNKLRLVLAAMMLASCFWLLSLLTSFIGSGWTLFFALLIVTGLLFSYARHHSLRAALTVASISVLVIGLVMLTLHYSKQPLQDQICWQPLSEAAINQALAANKRVFIDVTVDWCVTCKANKFNVLLSNDVQKALQAEDVIALRGDWTHPSDTINQFLQKCGMVAVPFNQIYGPGLPQGKILSPLLNKKDLLLILQQAKGNSK